MAGPNVQGLSLSRLSLPLKIVFGGAMVTLVAVVYYVIIHTEIATKIDAQKRHAIELDTELANQRQSQASYFADRDELVRGQQKQRELNKVLPETTEAASFLSALQSVSNTSGIDLKAWQPQEEQPQAFFAKVPMRLEVSGRYHQIAKFVYEVGKLDRIINMENIDLGNPHVVGDDVVVSGHCLATTFHTIKKGGK